jgi:serine/threonine protein kinase
MSPFSRKKVYDGEMSELKHPNIVQLYDWGKDKGQSYIAMQYLDGLTLEDLIRTQGRLNLNLVVAIAKPVAEAAYYIHQKDLVRNDIKPVSDHRGSNS